MRRQGRRAAVGDAFAVFEKLIGGRGGVGGGVEVGRGGGWGGVTERGGGGVPAIQEKEEGGRGRRGRSIVSEVVEGL